MPEENCELRWMSKRLLKVMNHKMNSLQPPHFRIKLTALMHPQRNSLSEKLRNSSATKKIYLWKLWRTLKSHFTDHLCRLQEEVAKTTDLRNVFQCTQIRSKLTRATVNKRPSTLGKKVSLRLNTVGFLGNEDLNCLFLCGLTRSR